MKNKHAYKTSYNILEPSFERKLIRSLKKPFFEHQLSYKPVLKKRQNFLKSSPTSIEGALRLLSAPSGRF
jgi:hypothetical protein